jgi:hypothetical protein
MVTQVELFESPYLIPINVYLWVWISSEVYKSWWIYFLAGILDAVTVMKNREDQLKRT